MAAPFGGFDEHLVGDDVQLLLRLALHVLAARAAQHADQRALVDVVRDLLAGHDHIADQAGEIAARLSRDRALFFDDELDQTLAHAFSLAIMNF